MLLRWMQAQESKEDPDFAPQKVFDIIGYGKTASSPIEAMPFKFLLEKDKIFMNRNKLLSASQDLINEKNLVINLQKKEFLNYQEIKLEIKCTKLLKIFLRKRKFWSMEWKLEKN